MKKFAVTEVKKLYTLCIIHNSAQILLAIKKKGWGAGRWQCGFGGKVESGESIESAAVRELQEEAGIAATQVAKKAVVEFRFTNNPGVVTEMHVFGAKEFTGEPKESDEMAPQWFEIEKIPYDQMWESDRHWLPVFLGGKNFRAEFLYGEKDNLLEKKIEII